jgi:type I restriction enzyme M protein
VSQGKALEELIEEKKTTLRKGDQIIQDIENGLIAKLDALEAQGTLTPAIKKDLKAEAKAAIKVHMGTEAYAAWQQATTDDYNERIANLREALEDDFLAKVKTQVEDYPIFMAIAEDIGYDATGRPTAQNELDTVTRELARFLEQLEAGDTRLCLTLAAMKTRYSLLTGEISGGDSMLFIGSQNSTLLMLFFRRVVGEFAN